MKKIDPIILSIILVTAILLGGITISAFISQGLSVAQYQKTDVNRPRLAIGQKQFDFGRIKLTDIKTQDVEIKNIGNKPLVLSDFITSCDCTSVQVTINGQVSPKFSMHRNPDWRGEVAPQASAIISLIYEPKIMPVKGKVARTVVFKTNDPVAPLATLGFSAEVE